MQGVAWILDESHKSLMASASEVSRVCVDSGWAPWTDPAVARAAKSATGGTA
jgi:hypothetical protein